MSLPIVAIVGRPNVGKSSLLNALVARRVAIVEATAGVTRDRIHVPWALDRTDDARYVELVDTGGMGIEDVDNLTDHVEEQIAFAVEAAALIIFLVDGREGLTPLDRHVAEELRRQKKPVILVANKVDTPAARVEIADLHRLGFGAPLQISAKHLAGIADLREMVAEGRLGRKSGRGFYEW